MFSLSPIPPTSAGLRATSAHIDDSRAALVDAMGALNPVVPMWLQPGQRPVQPDLMGGMRHAERGIAALESALASMPPVRGNLRSALESASREARTGYETLTLETVGMPDVAHASNSFNAAVNWLGIADDLLALELGRFTPSTLA